MKEVVYDGTGELDTFPVGAGTGLICLDGDAVELEELLKPWIGQRVKLVVTVEQQLGSAFDVSAEEIEADIEERKRLGL